MKALKIAKLGSSLTPTIDLRVSIKSFFLSSQIQNHILLTFQIFFLSKMTNETVGMTSHMNNPNFSPSSSHINFMIRAYKHPTSKDDEK